MMRMAALLACALVAATGCSSLPTVCPAYEDQIRQWRQERVRQLREKRGWLTLAGRHWLSRGAQTLGSASDNTIQLPPSAPAHVGVLTVGEGTFVLAVQPGVDASTQAGPFERKDLASDGQTKVEPDLVRVGGVEFTIIIRGGEPALRVWDLEAKARLEFRGTPAFPIDPAWRIPATWRPYETCREVEVPTAISSTEKGTMCGELHFLYAGEKVRLFPLGGPEDDELFLVFADATSGDSTYGGGRFLAIPWPDAEGTTVLDFNKAINPPCAFTLFATCPVAKPENRLPFPVTAGEKVPADHGTESPR